MACLLTQSYSYAGCKTGISGISEVLLAPLVDITAIALTANVFTTITRTSTTLFRRYVLDKNKGDFSYPLTYTEESGTLTYEHNVKFDIKGLTVALNAEIKLIAQNTLAMIVRDRNGIYWMAGVGSVLETSKGMNLMTVGASSGRAGTDVNGYTFEFKGEEGDYMHTVDPTIIAALLIAAP